MHRGNRTRGCGLFNIEFSTVDFTALFFEVQEHQTDVT